MCTITFLFQPIAAFIATRNMFFGLVLALTAEIKYNKCNAINNLTVSLHDKYTEKRIFIIRVRNYYQSGGSSVGDVLDFFPKNKQSELKFLKFFYLYFIFLRKLIKFLKFHMKLYKFIIIQSMIHQVLSQINILNLYQIQNLLPKYLKNR